ncbi:SA1320 family protein [Cytobacillus horneckiae]|uniref:SA1320 family protein n=1 Tax=Cytobacillus horneckiae TaxID=549687 RepID=UPI003D9A0B7E
MTTIKSSPKVNKEVSINNDKDLVELAGYHAYTYPLVESRIEVNDNSYRVINTYYQDPTGLDAMTVMNVKTKEISIIYVGTDASGKYGKQDVLTDAQLLSDLTPAQLAAARDYYNEMNQEYKQVGGVQSIAGNSLGGGLVGAVAIENPKVKAVTLNPALLPDGMMDPDKPYDNITNYFSSYDVLTQTLIALNLHDRIPGKQYEIFNGIPEFSKLATNHTGYLRNEDGSQFYMIGEVGKPGYGRIYIDADAHIVSSIWTGVPLYGGHSEHIEINKETLDILASAMQNHVTERLSLAHEYLGNSVAIVEDEGTRFYERLNRLQRTFEELFENIISEPLFIGITSISNRLTAEIDYLISLLNIAESHSKSLNYILNSPPAELLEHIFQTNVSVESLFAVLRNQLYELRADIQNISRSIIEIVSDKIPELFRGGKDAWYDAVVGELSAHYDIVNGNRDKLLSHISEFKKQIQDVAANFQMRDQSLGQSIKSNSTHSDSISVQGTNTYKLEDSPYMELRMKIKEFQMDTAYTAFTLSTQALLFPLLEKGQLLTFAIESTLEILSASIKGATHFALSHTIPGKLFGLFSDYDDKIRNIVANTLQPLDELAATIEGVRKGLGRLIIEYPTLLNNFRPYVDSAIFNNSGYFDVHLYNLASIAILREMKLLFDDVVYQLGNNKAEAIEALCEVSKKLKNNMGIFYEQVDRGTLN